MKQKNTSLTEFLSIFSRSYGAYKFEIFILALLGFVNGLLGGIGISAVIPLFSFVSSESSSTDDVVTRITKSLLEFLGVGYSLNNIVFLIVTLFLFKAAFSLIAAYMTGRIVLHYQEATRIILLRQTLASNWQYLLTQKLGHLETVLMKNVEKATLLLEHTSLSLMMFMTLVSYVIVAFNISAPVTLSIFVAAGAMFVFLRSFPNRIEQISIRLERYYREIAHHVNESILGMKTVKTRGVEGAVMDASLPYVKGITRESLKIRLVNAIPSSLLEPVSVILVVGIFLFGRNVPGFSIAALGAVIYVVKQIFSYAVQLQTYVFSIRELTPYARTVLSYKETTEAYREENTGTVEFSFRDSLEFRHVAFTHQNNKEVFSQLSFHIKKGELVGLIGPSGAGKTTLVDLLLRLFEPSKGGIFLDGVNVKEISEQNWRLHIGYVPQEVFLLNATIAQNIKFYDQTITDDAMIEAAKLANIYNFIESLPEKWETEVGERGVMLSGGQKQRIGIAMALARKPEIVVFDEATSALDNESEALVKQAMENMRGKVTVLAIAHRLSTVLDADRIIALEGGRVVEEGKPSVLLARQGSYLSKMKEIATH